MFWDCAFEQRTFTSSFDTCDSQYELTNHVGTSSIADCESKCEDHDGCKFFYRNTSNGWCGLYSDCTNKRTAAAGVTYEYVCEGMFLLAKISSTILNELDDGDKINFKKSWF